MNVTQRTLLSCVVSISIFISCENESQQIDSTTLSSNTTTSDLLTKSEIDQIIYNKLEKNGKFEWNMVDDHVLISALILSDSIASIGYNATSSDYVNYESFNQSARSFDETKAKIKAIFATTSSNRSLSTSTQSQNFLYEDKNFPIIDVKIYNQETLDRVRDVGNIRFIEPVNYTFNESNITRSNSSLSSGSGCGDVEAQSIHTNDYVTISPNALQSWNYTYMNIPQAWNYTTGKNVTIGVIDSGVFQEQSMLNDHFSISNANRNVENYGTYVDSWWPWSTETDGVWDKCGHGTQMAGIATAPRSNKGTPVGVAYDANLITVRATSNVVLDSYHEQKGVANALRLLADRSDVKIISMSLGHIASVGRIEDAVKYAHAKGKIIVAAGGTSTTFTTWYGVIFPAWMPETVAVTGVTDATDYETCDICHDGKEIDFTIVMQRSGNGNRNALTLPQNGYGSRYVSGSSAATATFAGISALVWSKYPNESREQILNRLKKAGEFYPNKNGDYGWGTVDALKAIQ